MVDQPGSALVTRFSIELDGGDDRIFHGGETLTGNILIQLSEKTTLQVKLSVLASYHQ